MHFVHCIVAFLGVVLTSLWMVVVIDGLVHGKLANFILPSNYYKAVPILLLMLAFVIRMWYVTLQDVEYVINSIFGLSSCEPTNINFEMTD